MMAAVLDSLLGSCARKLHEIITDEVILILGVKEELAELRPRIDLIRCCLDDAERRIEEPAVNKWFGQLRDAIYDVDDIIDLARFEGSKLLSDHPSSSSSKKSVGCNGLSVFSCFSNIQARREVAVRIRSLNKKIEKISKDKIFLTFNSTQNVGQGSTSKQRKSSKLVEPNLVGKEIIRSSRELVDLVLAHKENKDYKLAIVGTGGVGKTTLAQKIYNDQKIKGNFKKHAWICVSQEYDEVALLTELLRNIGVYQEQGETITELQSKIAETIENTSFFLVLDDVWKRNLWINLLKAPLNAAAAVVILVTTRDEGIAKDICAGHTHRVDLMSVEVGWELLRNSMGMKEEKVVQNLRNTGIEIVRKCGYLPLAIKVIASVLASKDHTENEWRKVLRRSAWSMGNLPIELKGALYLSYDDLPRHLKQCFLYLALFPEDQFMFCDDLIRLWVAEGFVEEQEEQLLEDTAKEYYYELIYRNLLQPDPLRGDHTWCKMHDLLRQLASYVSREETFCGDPQSMEATTFSKLRRVSIVTEKDSIMLPNVDKQSMRARTLSINCVKPPRVESTIFKMLPCIRVLDLNRSSIQSIPGCIGNLIHLRLLDLDDTEISCLPESIGSLINLQILNLQRCGALHSLPSAITRLCNLRRLGLADTPIKQVPKGIGTLEFLNDLEGFPVGTGSDDANTQDGWNLEELGQLSRLRQLDMVRLERAVPSSTHSLLTDKQYLKVLNLHCSEQADDPYLEKDIDNIEKIFEELKPPQSLEDLLIDGFFGQRYPSWLCANHLSSVKFLDLWDCNSCVHLPPVGQLPNLKFLKIDGAVAVTRIGPEIVGCSGANPRSMDVVAAFPKLETLVIKNMPSWEEWCFDEEEDAAAAAIATEGGGDGSAEMRKGEAPSPRMQLFPRLKELSLVGCPKLRGLPRQLGQEATGLKVLLIRGTRSLKVVEDLPFLSDELFIVGCEGLERVSNLPQVRELKISRCPNLRCVEGVGGLQELWLDVDMEEISSLWVPGLQDVDVYTWPRYMASEDARSLIARAGGIAIW